MNELFLALVEVIAFAKTDLCLELFNFPLLYRLRHCFLYELNHFSDHSLEIYQFNMSVDDIFFLLVDGKHVSLRGLVEGDEEGKINSFT